MKELSLKIWFVLLSLNTKPKQGKHLSDEEIIERILLNKDAAMVEILYERYSDKVYRKCLSFVKEAATAEDLTQDIFIKIYVNLSSFKQQSRFSTWLYSITYNFCVDYIRKNAREKISPIEDGQGEPIKNVEIDNAEELAHIAAERLLELLEKIRSEDKLILLMKYRDDLSIKEIQDVLSISESAVKMRIKRAKEKIQELYRQYYHDY